MSRHQHHVQRVMVANQPVIAYIVRDPNPLFAHYSIWVSGNDSAPLKIGNTVYLSNANFIYDPQLSNDLASLLYIWEDNSAAAVKDKINVTPADDTDPEIIVARNPSGSPTNQDSWIRATPIWRPDGLKIFYMGENNSTDRRAEIRSVNPDGTGNTLVYNRPAGNFFSYQTPFDLSINEDGSKLAWWDAKFSGAPGEGEGGLWVCNADGTGAAQIVVQLNTDGFQVKGFAHLSNTIAYYNGTGTKKIPFSGGSPTVLLANPLTFFPTGRRCWTPDDTKLYGLRLNVYGSAPRHVIAFLATDGSGTITDLFPERRVTNASVNQGPTLGPDNRLYWWEASQVVSVELDGSNYKVDHDMTGLGYTAASFRTAP